MPKLRAERDADYIIGTSSSHGKKGTVDVHRGGEYSNLQPIYYRVNIHYSSFSETYQFAYFFRATEPHSVLVKVRFAVISSMPCLLLPAVQSRNFVLDKKPPKHAPPPTANNVQVQPKKRKGGRSSKKANEGAANKKRKVQGKRKKDVDLSDEEVIEISSDEEDNQDMNEIGRSNARSANRCRHHGSERCRARS